MVQKTRLKIAIHKFLDEFFLPALFLSVSLSQKKKSTPLHFSRCNNAISGHGGPDISSRRHLHDTTSNQPNTIGHVASSASKTRVDAWASLSNPRTVGGHVCSLFAAAKRQDTGKQCEHTLHRPLCVHHPCLLATAHVFFFLLFHCSLLRCNSSRTFSP